MTRHHVLAPITCFIILLAKPQHPDALPDSAMPEWLRENMTHLVAGGDRWVTDNAPYRSADEPWDAYGLEWEWGLGKQTVTGRLYGIRDGQDADTFWQFRMYWHPARMEAVLVQYGVTGAIGEGVIRSLEDGRTESIQSFTAPDGSTSSVRHLSRTTGTIHDTRSFDRAGNDWQPRRNYVWHRRPR